MGVVNTSSGWSDILQDEVLLGPVVRGCSLWSSPGLLSLLWPLPTQPHPVRTLRSVQPALCLPPCTCTQPVVITLPEDIESDFQCQAEGSFPNRENACKSYFVCIKKPETEGFSLTERACSPSLAFDTNLGV